MNKKKKKMISVLACIMLILAVIPAAAQEDMGLARFTPATITCQTEGCGKTAKYWFSGGHSSYQYFDASEHSMLVEQLYQCPDYHTSIRYERMKESHGWSDYDSIAHNGNYHKYIIKCKCGLSQTVEIICTNWETEGHKKPW